MKRTLLKIAILGGLLLATSGIAGAADRYWVGGTANWDATAGSKWAATSGAAGGQTVPTSADDCFFDANSNTAGAITVTVTATANCNSLNFTGFTRTFTGSSQVNLAGSLTLATGMTHSYSGTYAFTSTATGKTVTFAGKTHAGAMTFSGVGGGWTFQDAANISGALTITGGAVDTNGKAVTLGAAMSMTGASVRSLTMGVSTLSIVGAWTVSGSNFTVSAASSTITSSANGLFTGGGQTYGTTTWSSMSSTVSIDGNTFYNLSFTASGSGALVFMSGNFTVNNLLTANGGSALNRLYIKSSTTGTPRTITTGSVSASYADFTDITGAGSGWNISAITGGSGDCGGNSGITFSTATSQTWSGTSGGNWSANAWTSRVPVCQDDAIINAAFVAAQTITVDSLRMGSTTMIGSTGSPLLALSGRTVFGSLVLIPGMTISGGISFAGRSANSIVTSAGQTFPTSVTFGAVTGTYTFTDAFTNASTFTLQNGTINTNSQAVQTVSFSATGGTLTLGATTFTVTGAGGAYNNNGAAINAGTSLLKLTNTSASGLIFRGGLRTYNNVWFAKGGGTGTITILDANTFNDFKDDGTAAHTISFPASATTTVTTFTVSGATAPTGIQLVSGTVGTRSIISSPSGTISGNYLYIQDVTATGGATWRVIDGEDLGNNSGWTFVTQTSPQGIMAPYTAADDATVGTITWVNPNNIKEAGSVYSTITLGSAQVSHYLKATGYAFTIPVGATINGIEVYVLRKASLSSGAANIKDSQVKVVKSDGTIGATNRATTTLAWPTSDTYAVYGSSVDLWGETWSAADINDVDFGMVISGVGTTAATSPVGSIDVVYIAVYYTPAVSTPTFKLWQWWDF